MRSENENEKIKWRYQVRADRKESSTAYSVYNVHQCTS